MACHPAIRTQPFASSSDLAAVPDGMKGNWRSANPTRSAIKAPWGRSAQRIALAGTWLGAPRPHRRIGLPTTTGEPVNRHHRKNLTAGLRAVRPATCQVRPIRGWVVGLPSRGPERYGNETMAAPLATLLAVDERNGRRACHIRTTCNARLGGAANVSRCRRGDS